MSGGNFLEVTFQHGKPWAAYRQLFGDAGQKAVRREEWPSGIIVDYGENDCPIGIEITSPQLISLLELNALLTELHAQPLEEQEAAPLLAG